MLNILMHYIRVTLLNIIITYMAIALEAMRIVFQVFILSFIYFQHSL